jgi:hypothetical protein
MQRELVGAGRFSLTTTTDAPEIGIAEFGEIRDEMLVAVQPRG